MTRTDRPTHLRLAGSDALTTGKPEDDKTSSLGLSMREEGRWLVARVQARGVLDSKTLPTLIQLGHLALYRGCAELIIDVHAVTDFPLRLFAELLGLSHAANAHRVLFRVVGLTNAIVTALATAPMGAPPLSGKGRGG